MSSPAVAPRGNWLLLTPDSTALRLAGDLLLTTVAVLDFWQELFPSDMQERALVFTAIGAVLLRRNLPLVSFLCTLPALFTTAHAIAASSITLCALARKRQDGRLVLPASVALAIGNFFCWQPWKPQHGQCLPAPTVADWTQHSVYSMAIGAAPAALGLLMQARQDLACRIADLAKAHEQERLLLDRAAVTRERARIGREMHDTVSHKAGLIAVQAGALEVTTADPAVRSAAATLRELAVSTLEELRTILLVLRAEGAGPADLCPRLRLTDLENLTAESGADVTLHISPAAIARQLPESVERTAYRTVQEALTNVRKHAPGVRATVRIDVDDTHLYVRIRNDTPAGETPRRPSLPGGGHGLVGLWERAAALHGELTAGPLPGGGFAVRLAVPLTGTRAPPPR
ncbi:sensor histidine kinase [Streptomyces sp. NPDC002537]